MDTRPVRVDDSVLAALEQVHPVHPAGAAAPAAQSGAHPGAARTAAAAPADCVLRYRYLAGVFRSTTRPRRLVKSSCCISVTARACASTMGFTAADGLPMGTRCGNLDRCGVVPDGRACDGRARHQEAHLPANRVCSECRGFPATCVISSRLSREPGAKAPPIDLYVYRIGRELGSLAAALGGLDAIVFTAGIGENSRSLRERVCRDAAWLGVELDAEANQGPRLYGLALPASRRAGVGHSDQRGADDRATHAPLTRYPVATWTRMIWRSPRRLTVY